MSKSSSLKVSWVQGNKPLRLFAVLMLVVLITAHFLGTVNLLEPSILWLMILMSLNALQASFTGFCPMFKDKDGNCVACGVQCSEGDPSDNKTSGCCEGTDNKKASSETNAKACCGSQDSESNAKGCCEEETATTKCCSDTGCGESSDCIAIKVLGTGCKTCANTVKLIEQTAQEKNIKVCVSKVEDVAEIASFGVMSTPGIVINDQVLHAGSMPTKEQVSSWLNEYK